MSTGEQQEKQAESLLTLVEKIRAGLCTPILGAGAAVDVLPLGGDLAEELLSEHESQSGKKAPLPDRRDLAKVTEYIAVNKQDNLIPKIRIANHLKRRGRPDFSSTDEPHRTLAALRLPIYLTTNYDDFMYEALIAAGAQPIREVARWTKELREKVKSRFDDGYQPTRDSPVVFHIHGHCDIPESMVATEDDYLDFLVNMSVDLKTTSKKAILPPRIRNAINSSTLLFVGYSLNDVNFRMILRGLIGPLSPSQRQMSLSVQYCCGQPGDLERYVEDYFGRSMNLSIFWFTARQFCQVLNEKLDSARSEAASPGS